MIKQYETKTIEQPKNVEYDFEVRVKVDRKTNQHEWSFFNKNGELIRNENGFVPIDVTFDALLAMNSITHYILSKIKENGEKNKNCTYSE